MRTLLFPVLEGYARHSITGELLETAKQAVLSAQNTVAERNQVSAEAQKATETKNIVHKALLLWWRDFVKVVHMTLRDDPQLKEQVNIVAPYKN